MSRRAPASSKSPKDGIKRPQNVTAYMKQSKDYVYSKTIPVYKLLTTPSFHIPYFNCILSTTPFTSKIAGRYIKVTTSRAEQPTSNISSIPVSLPTMIGHFDCCPDCICCFDSISLLVYNYTAFFWLVFSHI